MLTQGLIETGVQTAVACCRGGPNEANIQAMSSEAVIRLPSQSQFGVSNISSIRRLIRTWKPDILQTWLPMMDILGGTLCPSRRVRHVLSERSQAGSYRRPLRDRLRRRIGRRAAAIVANSSGGAQYWRGAAHDERVHVIPNGLRLEQIKAARAIDRKVSGIPVDARVILYVGRLSDEKNIPSMLRGVELLLERHADVHLVMLGVGPRQDQVRELIARSAHASRLHLVGWSDQVWSWMHAADALVAVSHFEGDPNVPLEAAACGCPLVLSDIDAYRSFFGEAGATLVDKDAPDSIAAGLEEALSGGAQIRLRAATASDLVAGRSQGAMVQSYLDLYRSLLN
ncbi:MAG: glycosyltransferase family 4 protein [Phycisphaerales bacterium]|nr:glycosyltransferase family 4 protein [Phycisphaerales bacterium]